MSDAESVLENEALRDLAALRLVTDPVRLDRCAGIAEKEFREQNPANNRKVSTSTGVEMASNICIASQATAIPVSASQPAARVRDDVAGSPGLEVPQQSCPKTCGMVAADPLIVNKLPAESPDSGPVLAATASAETASPIDDRKEVAAKKNNRRKKRSRANKRLAKTTLVFEAESQEKRAGRECPTPPVAATDGKNGSPAHCFFPSDARRQARAEARCGSTLIYPFTREICAPPRVSWQKRRRNIAKKGNHHRLPGLTHEGVCAFGWPP